MTCGTVPFWAKTTPEGMPGISVHDHCLNVGCVAEALLAALPPSVQALLPSGSVTLAALHDVGKITIGVQAKCPPRIVPSEQPPCSSGICALIREFVSLRCSVIILSATLTGARRRELLAAAFVAKVGGGEQASACGAAPPPRERSARPHALPLLFRPVCRADHRGGSLLRFPGPKRPPSFGRATLPTSKTSGAKVSRWRLGFLATFSRGQHRIPPMRAQT